MVKVYALALVVGVAGLLIVVLGGVLVENLGRRELDPGRRIGNRGKAAIGALLGFGMGGVAAEFAPIDLTWQVSLLLAAVAATLSILWVRYSLAETED